MHRSKCPNSILKITKIPSFKKKKKKGLKEKGWLPHSKLTEFLTEGGKVYKNGSLMLSFSRSGSSWGQNDIGR